MKETFIPHQNQVDPAFDTNEAAQWDPPVAGEHVNFLDAGTFGLEPVPGQMDQAEALRERYLGLETTEKGRGMSELLTANLGVLDEASVGRFGNTQHHTSGILLNTRDIVDNHILDAGHDLRFMDYVRASHMSYRIAQGNNLPEQTTTLLSDLYELTGATVLRDDRETSDQLRYRRYLVGNYGGRRLLFVELSLAPNKQNQDRLFTVSVTDNMDVLQELSQKEITEISPELGARAHTSNKQQLSEAKAMISEAQGEIRELTEPRPDPNSHENAGNVFEQLSNQELEAQKRSLVESIIKNIKAYDIQEINLASLKLAAVQREFEKRFPAEFPVAHARGRTARGIINGTLIDKPTMDHMIAALKDHDSSARIVFATRNVLSSQGPKRDHYPDDAAYEEGFIQFTEVQALLSDLGRGLKAAGSNEQPLNPYSAKTNEELANLLRNFQANGAPQIAALIASGNHAEAQEWRINMAQLGAVIKARDEARRG